MAYQDPTKVPDFNKEQSDFTSLRDGLTEFIQDPIITPPDATEVVLSASDGSIMASPDFASPLSFEPLGIVINSAGHIRSGQSKYNTGKGWWIGSDNNTAKLSIGDPNGRYLTWDGTNFTINGYVPSGIGAFGGNGADGALTVASGTTTINLGGSAYVVKNYTSISISAGATVNFSNPHANGTVIHIKSQGAVTVAGTLDASAMGAAGGAAVTASVTTNGITGNDGMSYSHFFPRTNGGLRATATHGTAGAAPTLSITNANFTNSLSLLNYKDLWTASGSGSGAVIVQSGTGTMTSGKGGNGGGTLIIECAGSWTYTGTIAATGETGGDAIFTSGAGNLASGGGAGGPGGFVIGLYNTLVVSSGNTSTVGGTGGYCYEQGGIAVAGGGGSGANLTIGNDGTDSTANNTKVGADGPAGFSLIAQNTFFA